MPYRDHPEYKRMESRLRLHKRLGNLYLLISAVAIGLFVMQTAERASDAQDYQQTVTTMTASVYGLSYALRSEQRKAGKFEIDKILTKQDLIDNIGYTDNLRSRVDTLEAELDKCRAAVRMVSDQESWTGNTSIRVGE